MMDQKAAFAGLAIVVAQLSTHLGIAFAFSAAGCWALYILFGKRASELGSKTAVALGMATACAVTLPFGIVMAGEKLLVSPVLWLGLVVVLLSSAIPYILEMKALERLSSRTFGVIQQRQLSALSRVTSF